MSDKDEHKSDDAILASYLEGSDGLSDAYRRLDQLQPPAHLDERILAAAWGDEDARARKSTPAGGFDASSLRGLLSLAASLVVGIMIGSVFLGDLDLRQDAASATEKAAAQDDASQAAADAPSREADLDAVAESFAVAEDVAPEPPAPAATRGAQGQGRTAGLSTADEIVVTGARIQRAELSAAAPAAVAAEPDYRQSVVLWLREIDRLQQQLRVSDSADLQQQVEEERALFLQRYPGIGLELELESLRHTTPGN